MIEEVVRLKRALFQIEEQANRLELLAEARQLKYKVEEIERLGKLIDQDIPNLETASLRVAVLNLKAFIANLESSEEYKQELEKDGE